MSVNTSACFEALVLSLNKPPPQKNAKTSGGQLILTKFIPCNKSAIIFGKNICEINLLIGSKK